MPAVRTTLLVLLAVAPGGGSARCCERHLPEPFHGVVREELLRSVYPRVDPSGRLGVGDAAGRPLVGALQGVTVLPGTGEATLAGLIETWVPEPDGLPPQGGAASYGVDLALFAMRGDAPVLLTWLRDAWAHGGHGSVHLDAVAYPLTERVAALGIREASAHPRHLRESLRLVERRGQTFHVVFERGVLESNEGIVKDALDADLDGAAMAEIYGEAPRELAARRQAVVRTGAPGAAGYRDIVVVETVMRRLADGELQRSEETERWAFDRDIGAYRKRP